MTRIADLQDRLRRLAKRREDEGIYTDVAICEEAAEALSRTGAVKVKALDWIDGTAACLYGAYTIHKRADTMWEAVGYGTFIDGPHTDAEAAKAAAQSDYERRILSALELVEPEGGQEAAADAVQFLYKHGDLTHSAAHRSVKLLTDNGFVIYRRPA